MKAYQTLNGGNCDSIRFQHTLEEEKEYLYETRNFLLRNIVLDVHKFFPLKVVTKCGLGDLLGSLRR